MSAKAGIEVFSFTIRSVKRSPCLKAILIHFRMNCFGSVPSRLLILAIFFFFPILFVLGVIEHSGVVV